MAHSIPVQREGTRLELLQGFHASLGKKLGGSNKFSNEGNFVKKSWKIVEVFLSRWNVFYLFIFVILFLFYFFRLTCLCEDYGKKNERISTAYNKRKKIAANAFKGNERGLNWFGCTMKEVKNFPSSYLAKHGSLSFGALYNNDIYEYLGTFITAVWQ